MAVIERLLRLRDECPEYPAAHSDFARVSTEIGDDAIGPLVTVLADQTRSEGSRWRAAIGLGAIGRSATGEAYRTILEALMDCVRCSGSTDDWVSHFAAEELMAMDARAVRPELLRLRNAPVPLGVLD